MQWIGCNKGDGQRPELRTISVSDFACHIKHTTARSRSFVLLPHGVNKRCCGEPLVLQFMDVNRAYPHAEVLRDNFYIEKVPKMGLPEDTCLLSRRSWNGMRDAGQTFEFAGRDHFLDHDFKQGVFLSYFVHGDDYVGLVVRGDLDDS